MSIAAALCHSCSNEVSGQQICCQGYCNAVFHLKCSGVAEDLLEAISENRQVFWLCRGCTNLLLDMRHRKSVHSAYESGQESLLNTHSRIVEELKSEILTELKHEFRTNFATLINSNSLTPKPTPRDPRDKPDPRKNLFGNKVETTKQSQPMLLGTGKPVSPRSKSMLVAARTSKFWLYITRISRTVTVDQVTKLAIERLGTEDVEVTRLVAKGKDVSTMSFISFRIGMDMALKEKALATSTWPAGLVFREFEDRSTEISWEPKEKTASPKNSTKKGDARAESTPPNLPTEGNITNDPESSVESMEE